MHLLATFGGRIADKSKEIADILLAAGADLNLKNGASRAVGIDKLKGQTAIEIANGNNSVLAEYLKTKLAKPTKILTDRNTNVPEEQQHRRAAR